MKTLYYFYTIIKKKYKMVQIVISKANRFKGTETYRFKTLEEGSLFMMKQNLSHRIIDILEDYSSVN
jgi:hypothetical protein